MNLSKTWILHPAVHSLPPVSHSSSIQVKILTTALQLHARVINTPSTTSEGGFIARKLTGDLVSKSHFGNCFLGLFLVPSVIGQLSLKQTLMWRFAWRKFTGELSWEQHLWGAQETGLGVGRLKGVTFATEASADLMGRSEAEIALKGGP